MNALGTFPGTVAIVGLGMVGGSLALRLREIGARVIGIDIDRETIAAARARGAIDSGSEDLGAAGEADLVIIATPLDRIATVGVAAARRMRAGALLTDVGSVKAPIVAALAAAVPDGVHFVGGHPMAGNEKQGIAAADASLLDDRVFVLTPTSRTAEVALATMRTVVMRLGMRPVVLDPLQHDELVAQVSHLPYLVSVALSRAVADDARSIGGPAMAEMTRAARSPAPMWTAICRANRDAILRALAQFEHELGRVRHGIEEGVLVQ
jgi:prephenate dehydrogenase